MPSLERYRTQGETSVGWRSMPSSSVRRPNRVLRLAYFVVLACGGISRLFAAPVITSVANAASNIALNAPLAQGAVFVLKGTGLGPANISLAPAAFQSTSLSGTSVAVTVGDTTVNALMYYTSDSQVAALLPSSTPTGSGSFTVTYDGQISNSMGHTIVASNLGILTIDSTGQGPAVVTFSDYGLVSAAKAANCGGPNTACGAANPGDTLTLWGTGLGPVAGDDASGAGLGQNMPDVPLTVWLGGVQASVIYQGRSGCCVGLDQIVFTVPATVPTGCAVPVVVQIGTAANTISNTTKLPVAAGSRNCTPNNAAFASASLAQLALAGPVSVGDIDLEKGLNGNGNGFEDEGSFQFVKATAKPGFEPFVDAFTDPLPPGTCAAFGGINPADNIPIASSMNLDGGSSVTVNGPSGSVILNGSNGNPVEINAAGKFLGPGVYTVTGTGGADVGPFRATLTILAVPTLASPSNAASLTVTRSSGMTVGWKGGDPSGNVQLTVVSATDATFTIGASATCTVPASAGTFTIPPYVLLALPAGNFGALFFGSAESQVPFTAPGLSVGTLHTETVNAGLGYFVLK